MKYRVPKLCAAWLIAACSVWVALRGVAQNGVKPAPFAPLAPRAASEATRPQYRLNAAIDYDLLTFQATGNITVPVAPGDALKDAVFFIYANAGGVGGDDERRKNIAVDRVTLNGATLPFKLTGAVLRVPLPQEQRAPFTLEVAWHGVVPRGPAGGGGLMDMMGGLSTDLGGLMGGGTQPQQKPKNVDYGLYTYGNGILSLGSFWYPQLAVRRNGQWAGEAPEGLGDVAFAEMSDFNVRLDVPSNVRVAATGNDASPAQDGPRRRFEWDFEARNVRDFAVLMSEDYAVKMKPVEAGGKSVMVVAYTKKQDAAKVDKAIDIAAHALQIYAKRFGAYPYDNFKVVEGPIRGGAGGMEFSGLVSIASALYGDLDKQMNDLAGGLGVGGMDKLLEGFEEDGGAPAPAPQMAPKTASKPGAAPQAAPQLPENPASSLLKDLLGQQGEIFESIFEATIAHEVAHQWWAIQVGSDSLHAPFVDESLANYSSMLYFEDRYGREQAQKMIDLHLKTTYSMGRMLGGGDAPVNLKTSAYNNNIQYGAVVYGKGALFYEALRHAVGDAVFFASLREYADTYHNRLAGPRSLVEIVERRAPNAKVEALYQRWIEQTHGDEDITGGKAMDLGDLLGGIMGGGDAGGLLGDGQ